MTTKQDTQDTLKREITKNIQENLTNLLGDKSQISLSSATGISPSVINSAYNGRSLISLHHLVMICDHLRVSVESMMRGNAKPNQQAYNEGYIRGVIETLILRSEQKHESVMDDYWDSLIGLNRNLAKLEAIWGRFNELIEQPDLGHERLCEFTFLIVHYLDFAMLFDARSDLVLRAIKSAEELLKQYRQENNESLSALWRRRILLLKIDGYAYILQEMGKSAETYLNDCLAELKSHKITQDEDVRYLKILAQLFLARDHLNYQGSAELAKRVLSNIDPQTIHRRHYLDRYYEQLADVAFAEADYLACIGYLIEIVGEDKTEWAGMDDSLQDGAFNRLMSAYRRAGQIDNAIETYKVMLARNSRHNLPSAAWMIAQVEYVEILIERGEHEKTFDILRELHGQLSGRPLYRYTYLLEKVNEIMAGMGVSTD